MKRLLHISRFDKVVLDNSHKYMHSSDGILNTAHVPCQLGTKTPQWVKLKQSRDLNVGCLPGCKHINKVKTRKLFGRAILSAQPTDHKCIPNRYI